MSTSKTPQQSGPVTVSNITGSSVILGNNNKVIANIHFMQFKDNMETADPKLWEEVIAKMDEMLKVVKGIGDEHEELRDIDLIPAVGSAKKEAAAIAADPRKPKSSFIDKFKNICDLSGKAVEVGTKLAPFIMTVGKLLGIA
ncbi:hypothetical protein [Mucilaginibacter sp. OK283]|uniref:hypothetical protein n=1 Tax=Mucilaginibacter sp. OK283 TaxID=1881049 RepID=UPI0008D35282|nr:hypothetical protein [Mucilaginibacter sp. OK283]SEP06047.1 hypothetical protein SAMN05428947_106177 [Mucilaginibacter sp. OK283]